MASGILNRIQSILVLKFALIFLIVNVFYVTAWKNDAVLDTQGNFHLFWDWDDQNVTFEVQVRTKGYIGFGFSPNGGMKEADIVTGWVSNDNEVHFQDRFANDNAEPLIDKSQDYELLSGFENDTHTVFRFKRKKDTCDDKDFKITLETMHLIYAWRNEDPISATSNLQYHGSKNRGAKSIKLFTQKFDKSNFADDVYAWDMTMPNITLPPDTSYFCKYFKFPAQQNKHHRVGFEVVIQPGHENIVHHIVLYQCDEETSLSVESKLNDPSFNCVDDATFVPLCPTMLATRALGEEGEILPPHLGVPFGHTDKPAYFMLQVHFANPDSRPDIVDQTTVRIYITEKLRPNEGGVIFIRVKKSHPLIMPPKQPSFVYMVVSPSQCTELLPEAGINIYAVGFHMHMTGSKGYARHFRDGVELDLIAEDKYYDFNYQQPTILSREAKVLPGDVLASQCVYDTTDRTKLTVGGSKTTNEMCTLILYYYPLSNLTMCKATGSVKELLQIFKVEEMFPDNIHIKLPTELANISISEYLENYDVSDLTEYDMAHIQQVQIKDPVLSGECITQDDEMIPYSVERPNYTTLPYVAPLNKCNSSNFS